MNRFWRILQNRVRTWIQPRLFLQLMALTYVISEGFMAYERWFDHLRPVDLEPIVACRDVLVLGFVFFAGVLRAKTNHPLFWIDYGRWLARSPWRLPKPLPMGPVHLAISDVVFNLIVMALLHDTAFNLVRVPLLFLIGYLGVACAGLWRTHVKAFAYILAFGLGFVARVWLNPWIAIEAAAVLYPVASMGLWRSLRKFPWSISIAPSELAAPIKLTMSIDLNQWMAQQRPKTLGWPFELLRPEYPETGIQPGDGMLLSLLLGWWLYAVTAQMEDIARRPLLYLALIIIPASMSVVRLQRYTYFCHSPINSWGRLFTLRWIIPGYDKVFVAPLLTAAVPGIVIVWIVKNPAVEPLAVVPVAIALASMAALNLGPTLHAWRYTGQHRMAPRYASATHLRL
ncbi:MAG TPA: hypothetical protein VHX65_04660 [Pirellulales bacterium]|nr:hypothetical protein [Pirellulales bacterium]